MVTEPSPAECPCICSIIAVLGDGEDTLGSMGTFTTYRHRNILNCHFKMYDSFKVNVKPCISFYWNTMRLKKEHTQWNHNISVRES